MSKKGGKAFAEAGLKESIDSFREFNNQPNSNKKASNIPEIKKKEDVFDVQVREEDLESDYEIDEDEDYEDDDFDDEEEEALKKTAQDFAKKL